jgi:hypothetical protein
MAKAEIRVFTGREADVNAYIVQNHFMRSSSTRCAIARKPLSWQRWCANLGGHCRRSS